MFLTTRSRGNQSALLTRELGRVSVCPPFAVFPTTFAAQIFLSYSIVPDRFCTGDNTERLEVCLNESSTATINYGSHSSQ